MLPYHLSSKSNGSITNVLYSIFELLICLHLPFTSIDCSQFRSIYLFLFVISARHLHTLSDAKYVHRPIRKRHVDVFSLTQLYKHDRHTDHVYGLKSKCAWISNMPIHCLWTEKANCNALAALINHLFLQKYEVAHWKLFAVELKQVNQNKWVLIS